MQMQQDGASSLATWSPSPQDAQAIVRMMSRRQHRLVRSAERARLGGCDDAHRCVVGRRRVRNHWNRFKHFLGFDLPPRDILQLLFLRTLLFLRRKTCSLLVVPVLWGANVEGGLSC